MTRSARDRYVEGLDALLKGRMAALVKAREWELLAEVAHLAQDDAPTDLAVTDPALFKTWRDAVTRYHRAGWSKMTPLRAERERIASLLIDGYFQGVGDFARESEGRGVHEGGVEYRVNDRICSHLQANLPSDEVVCDQPLARQPIRPDIRIGREPPYFLAEVKRQFQKAPVVKDLRKLANYNGGSSGRFFLACHGRTHDGPGSRRPRDEIDGLARSWCGELEAEFPSLRFDPRRSTRSADRIEPMLAQRNYLEFDVVLISLENRSR